jgi:hypothetical protein
VAAQRTDLVTSKNIPDLQTSAYALVAMNIVSCTYLALEVIITGEEQSSRDRESNRRDATENLIALQQASLISYERSRNHEQEHKVTW